MRCPEFDAEQLRRSFCYLGCAVRQTYQRVYCDCSKTGRANDNGVDVELSQRVYVGFGVACAREHRLDERGNVAGRFAAKAGQQSRDSEAIEGGLYGRGREGWKQRCAVAQQLGENSTSADDQNLPELRIDGHADQYFCDAVANHLFD